MTQQKRIREQTVQTNNEQTVAVQTELSHMQCPECGKQMKESDSWPGLWICIDGMKPINDRDPFRYKCKGKHITKRGEDLFYEEIKRQMVKRN